LIIECYVLQLVLPLPEQAMDIMHFTEQQFMKTIAAFEKGRDPKLVHEALELIEAAERSVPTADTAARRQALSRRPRFL
jgi:hypothetical protein